MLDRQNSIDYFEFIISEAKFDFDDKKWRMWNVLSLPDMTISKGFAIYGLRDKQKCKIPFG